MKELDEILYDALRADESLMEAVGGRIVSTCFEVGPDGQDNTPLPCIIVTDDGWQNQPATKDDDWETDEDRVSASIEVDAESPKEVKRIVSMCRRVVAAYIAQMKNNEEDTPELDSLQASQLSWDWMKPCYWQTLTYNCITNNIDEDEQD